MQLDVQLDGGVHELELEDIVREQYEMDEELVDDSDFDEDFDDRMRDDVMDFVFGPDSDEDEL